MNIKMTQENMLKSLCEKAKIYAFQKGYPEYRDDFSQNVAVYFLERKIPDSMHDNLWGLLPHRWVDFLREYRIPRAIYKDPDLREKYIPVEFHDKTYQKDEEIDFLSKDDIQDIYRYLDRFERLVFSLYYLMGYNLREISNMAQYSAAALTIVHQTILKRIKAKVVAKERRRIANRDGKKKPKPKKKPHPVPE